LSRFVIRTKNFLDGTFANSKRLRNPIRRILGRHRRTLVTLPIEMSAILILA
jgi:hypothetical protein